MTPSDRPNEAMINENSPIWVSANPDCTAILSGCPVASMPKVPKMIIPTTTTTLSSAMVPQCWTMMSGLTIMPTEMKNTAPNRSFTGIMTRSMRSASFVPASIEPITNAPSASEKPDSTEKMAIKKHNPMAMISIISSLSTRLNRLNSVGNTKMPMVNQMMRKNDNFRMLRNISPLSTVWLMAMDDSTTIIPTATKSSMMSTASTSGTNRR